MDPATGGHRSVVVAALSGMLASVIAGREPDRGASREKKYVPATTRTAKMTLPLAKMILDRMPSFAMSVIQSL
jgi:hypothetical protein